VVRTLGQRCQPFCSTLSRQRRSLKTVETPTQSVRSSIQPFNRDPFECPIPSLRSMSG
jgi:hypothetical protein